PSGRSGRIAKMCSGCSCHSLYMASVFPSSSPLTCEFPVTSRITSSVVSKFLLLTGHDYLSTSASVCNMSKYHALRCCSLHGHDWRLMRQNYAGTLGKPCARCYCRATQHSTPREKMSTFAKKKFPLLGRLTAIAAVSGLALTACGDDVETADTGGADGETIDIAINHGWEEGIAVAELWALILEDEGYDVNKNYLDLAPSFSALTTGDMDFNMNIWQPVT